MPFTNIWDDGVPADTQLANLLGQDCRNIRVDTQQRMASISGTDAAKPNFAADAQPASWNGILFFATDTGRIYQFNNPAWNDVTGNFLLTSSYSRVKNVTQVTNTGNTTNNQIYSVALPVLQVSSFVRTTLMFLVEVITGFTLSVTLGGSANVVYNTNLGAGNYWVRFGFEFWNQNNLASQFWQGEFDVMTPPPTSWGLTRKVGIIPGTTTAINTGVAQNLVVSCQNGANADSVAFYGVFTEIF